MHERFQIPSSNKSLQSALYSPSLAHWEEDEVDSSIGVHRWGMQMYGGSKEIKEARMSPTPSCDLLRFLWPQRRRKRPDCGGNATRARRGFVA